MPCHENCKYCERGGSITENYCLECIDLLNPLILNGKCIKECPIDYHLVIEKKKCINISWCTIKKWCNYFNTKLTKSSKHRKSKLLYFISNKINV